MKESGSDRRSRFYSPSEISASFVIGIPCQSNTLSGIDALLSTVQMPSGIPVATVALGGGKNAAILAAQMLALSDDSLREKLRGMRKEMAEAVREKDDIISNQFKN